MAGGTELRYMPKAFLLLTVRVFLVTLSCLVLMRPAEAQSDPTVSLKEYLDGQYFSTSGTTRVGRILVVRAAGIVSVPPTRTATAPSTYKDGVLNPPSAVNIARFAGNDTLTLSVGEKVSALRIEVNRYANYANAKNDRITFWVKECDSCNGATKPSSYWASVLFEFEKGYLATADPAKVQDAISKVFSAVGETPMAEPPPPPPPDAPVTKTIEQGQTTEQVIAALGQPVKIVKLGAKQIYFYKDLKVTFTDGKVSDVE